MNLIEAINDPAIFGPAFHRNRKSWDAWLVFLAALFGLPLTQAQAQTFTQCTGRNGAAEHARQRGLD